MAIAITCLDNTHLYCNKNKGVVGQEQLIKIKAFILKEEKR